MSNNKRTLTRATLALLLAVGTLSTGWAQPFIEEIRAFKHQDSISFPPSGAILFVGSSTIRFWKDIREDFPGYTIIQRGFGGSHIPDVIRYANDIIFPYHPKQVVIYCGDNDLAEGDSLSTTPDLVFAHFKDLYQMIRKKLPSANILYISIKPSPIRAQLKEKVEKTNSMIKDYLATCENVRFLDIYPQMINLQGRPDPELFEDDRLHMNRRGYFIWKKAITPYLIK
jgi:lysophospholipase L1-like esterase